MEVCDSIYLLLTMVEDVPQLRVTFQHLLIEELGDRVTMLLEDRSSALNELLLSFRQAWVRQTSTWTFGLRYGHYGRRSILLIISTEVWISPYSTLYNMKAQTYSDNSG